MEIFSASVTNFSNPEARRNSYLAPLSPRNIAMSFRYCSDSELTGLGKVISLTRVGNHSRKTE
jgi:hypothetical protein